MHGWRNALIQRVEAKKSQLLQLKHGVLESMLLRDGQRQTTTEKQDNDLVATFLRLNREDQVWLPNFCLHIAAEMLHEIHLPAMLVDSAGNLIHVRVFRVDPMVQDPAATETTPLLPVRRILPLALDDLGREPIPAPRRHRQEGLELPKKPTLSPRETEDFFFFPLQKKIKHKITFIQWALSFYLEVVQYAERERANLRSTWGVIGSNIYD